MINWLKIKSGGNCHKCGDAHVGFETSYVSCAAGIVDPYIICQSCLDELQPHKVTIGDTVYEQTVR